MSLVALLDVVKEKIQGKRVVILGFGREGRSSYELLVKLKAHDKLYIADKNKFEGIEGVDGYISGDSYQSTLDDYDVVFKSPGVVLDKAIKEYKCVITSQMDLFFEAYRQQIVGITGTKGKSTTTTLIYHILKNAGRDAIIAGNIGIPVFDVAKDVKENSIIVCEMSSHQLEYMKVSPHRGVYLNIHEEHLDHYGVMEKYVAAKENIYKNMQKGDLLICNTTVEPDEQFCYADVITVNNEGESADILVREDTVLYGSREYKIPMDKIALLGKHSQFNIAVAYGICDSYEITDEEFEAGLVTYKSLPHRLEYFGTFDGVKYYDDSISTICDTVIQAIESVKDTSTLIIGGMDRGINYDELIEGLSRAKVDNIILMEATGKRIKDEIETKYTDFKNPERLVLVLHLEDAVKMAKEVTKKGKSCILSPAAASYGIFKNFEERGDVFKELVKKYNS